MQKSRYIPTGSQNGRSKLNEPRVQDLRRKASQGTSNQDLAIEFDIHIRTVKDVIAGVTWKHVRVLESVCDLEPEVLKSPTLSFASVEAIDGDPRPGSTGD